MALIVHNSLKIELHIIAPFGCGLTVVEMLKQLQALQFVQLQSGGYLCTAKSPNDFSEIERKNCSFANNSLPLHR